MLRVSYKKVYGYFYIKSPLQDKVFKCDIHPANCLFAICYHYRDERNDKMVQLVSFFSDIEHFKRCYKPNDMVDDLKKVVLYDDCPQVSKVINTLIKAKIPFILKYRNK